MVVRDLGKVVLIVMMGFDVFLMLIYCLHAVQRKDFVSQTRLVRALSTFY